MPNNSKNYKTITVTDRLIKDGEAAKILGLSKRQMLRIQNDLPRVYSPTGVVKYRLSDITRIATSARRLATSARRPNAANKDD